MQIGKINYWIYYLVISKYPLLNLPLILYRFTTLARIDVKPIIAIMLIMLASSFVLDYAFTNYNKLIFATDFMIFLVALKNSIELNKNVIKINYFILLIYAFYGGYVEYIEYAKYGFNLKEMIIMSEVWIDGYNEYPGSINGLFYHIFLLGLCLNTQNKGNNYLIITTVIILIGNIVTDFHAKGPILALTLSYIILILIKAKRIYSYTLLLLMGLIVINQFSNIVNIINNMNLLENNFRLSEYVFYDQNTKISTESTYLRILKLYGGVSLALTFLFLTALFIILKMKIQQQKNSENINKVGLLFFCLIVHMFLSSDGLLVYFPAIFYSWLIIFKTAKI